MCIIFVSHAQHPRYRLILAANREEVLSRATAPLAIWRDKPEILAGRDLVANGTWLGLNLLNGRWAGLTNVHDPTKPRKLPGEGRSRGEIVERWLKYDHAGTPDQFLSDLKADGEDYEGFNVLFGKVSEDSPSLHFFTNKNGSEKPPNELKQNAMYGLSNATLETPWPKLVWGKREMDKLIAQLPETDDPANEAEDRLADDLLSMLRDEHPQDAEMGANGHYGTGPRCLYYYIDSIDYGTRASTIILARKDGSVRYIERSFDRTGKDIGKKDMVVQLGKI